MSDENLRKERAWGLSTGIDLHNCDPKLVEDKEKIEKFVIELCDLIDMKRFGDVQIIYFGPETEGYQGYTALQWIETSNITAHFGLNPDGKTGYAYIDIFSCKSFDPKVAGDFAKEFFKAESFNMNTFYRRYWFEEKLEAQKGRGIRVEIEKKLQDIETKFQHLQVFDTKYFGRMLVLDNAIMMTEFDEFAYHEMIVHPAVNTHKNPKKVLVIGGGDAGAITELVKYKELEEIHLCELDGEVIESSKKYFPKICSGLNDSRVKVFVEDGAKFIKENKGYDVIIVDSPDPVGPAEVLFTKEFYEDVKSALSDDGILVTQSQSMFYYQNLIAELSKFIPTMFPIYRHYITLVPTYPSGEIGFSFCSKKYDPIKDFNRERAESIEGLKYYNSDLHIGSFALPTFIKKKVYGRE